MTGRRRTCLALSLTAALGLAGCSSAPPTPAAQASPPLASSSPVQAPGRVSVYPLPGSVTASPTTQVSFRGTTATDVGAVTVTGSSTGDHAGTLLAHSDSGGVSFLPTIPFTPGETVTVRTGLDLLGGTGGTVSFTVAQAVDVPKDPFGPTVATPSPGAGTGAYVSRPDLQPPALSVDTATALPASGDLMLTPTMSATGAGPMVVSPDGALVWFDPLPAGVSATDLKVQTYRGQPVLTWWQGAIVSPGYGRGDIEIYDQHYHQLAQVSAGNGYDADLHDSELLPNGSVLLISYPGIRWDARSIGGPADSTVLDAVVQQVDIATGAVEFEWHALDHVPLTTSLMEPTSNSTDLYDFFHLNSVDVGPDGDVLISARHTSALYDIDRASGAVNWQLGGKGSSFTVAPSASFSYQHDARWQGPDAISIFDNAARDTDHEDADASRGLLLHLDPAGGTVTAAEEWDPPGGLLATSQGSTQLLANGNVLVGWGALPRLTEYGADGKVRYDATLAFGNSYRAALQPWTGVPTQQPDWTVRDDGQGATTVSVSWNGDTRTARWQLLGGPDPDHLYPVGTAVRSGFETTLTVARPGGYLAVRALDAQGATLVTSTGRAAS